jgi:hypothetical protein
MIEGESANLELNLSINKISIQGSPEPKNHIIKSGQHTPIVSSDLKHNRQKLNVPKIMRQPHSTLNDQ